MPVSVNMLPLQNKQQQGKKITARTGSLTTVPACSVGTRAHGSLQPPPDEKNGFVGEQIRHLTVSYPCCLELWRAWTQIDEHPGVVSRTEGGFSPLPRTEPPGEPTVIHRVDAHGQYQSSCLTPRFHLYEVIVLVAKGGFVAFRLQF